MSLCSPWQKRGAKDRAYGAKIRGFRIPYLPNTSTFSTFLLFFYHACCLHTFNFFRNEFLLCALNILLARVGR